MRTSETGTGASPQASTVLDESKKACKGGNEQEKIVCICEAEEGGPSDNVERRWKRETKLRKETEEKALLGLGDPLGIELLDGSFRVDVDAGVGDGAPILLLKNDRVGGGGTALVLEEEDVARVLDELQRIRSEEGWVWARL
jgi:hypothetical protein